MRNGIRAAVLLALLAGSAAAQSPLLTIANDDTGVHYFHTLNGNTRPTREFGPGAAAGDYDNDGDLDLFIPQAYAFPDALYSNNGDGTFTEVAAQAGVAGLKEARAALWLDYDNDGWLDLFVAHDADAPEGQYEGDPATVGNYLYRNRGDGTFEEVSVAAGVRMMPLAEPMQANGGLAAADIDNDGWLDIYVSNWQNANALFRNRGDGTFEEIAASAGVLEPGYSYQPMFYDVDRDGWVDLLLNMDFGLNHLYRNLHNRVFVDVALATGFTANFNQMGMTAGDYDNDGDLDVVCTNIEIPYPNIDPLLKWTVLMHNNGSGGIPSYVERGLAAGIGRTGWGWGCTFFDIDNDGWLDLAATNGNKQPYEADPSRLFYNLADGTFVDIGPAAGFTSTRQGRGLIAWDYDADGDLDLYETNYDDAGYLYRNDTPNAGHWVRVDLLRAGSSNRHAVGAEVTLSAGSWTQTRPVTIGTSFLAQEPLTLHFGLGDATVVDQAVVRWPGGGVQAVANLPVDRRVRIREGIGLLARGDMDAGGDVDAADLTRFITCMSGPAGGNRLGCGEANFDADNDSDLRDFAIMQLAEP